MSNLSHEQMKKIIHSSTREGLLEKASYDSMKILYMQIAFKPAPSEFDTAEKLVDELKRVASPDYNPEETKQAAMSEAASAQQQVAAATAESESPQSNVQEETPPAAEVTQAITPAEPSNVEIRKDRFKEISYISVTEKRQVKLCMQGVLNYLEDFALDLNNEEDQQVINNAIELFNIRLNTFKA